MSTNRLLLIKTGNYEFISYIINISSSKNDLDFINDLTKINYGNIPTNFTGNVLIIKNDNKSVNLNILINGKEKIKKDKSLSKEAAISCFEIVELFDDGSVKHTGIVYCLDGGGGSEDINYTYHGSGGDSAPAEQWIDNSGNNNKLCGSYNFSTIGNASYANISGLGLSAKNGVIVVFAEFTSPMCISIPNYSNLTPSYIFNLAWNKTMTEVMLELNNYSTLSVTSELIKGLIKTTLLANLNSIQQGSSLNVVGCAGAPTTQATYCP